MHVSTWASRAATAALGVIAALTPSSGQAQQVAEPYVPPELYEERRWLEGSSITFCLWSVSPLMELDRAIGEAIGEALLLEADFYEYTNTVPQDSDDFWQAVFIQLAERCDAIMGFSLVRDLGADWLVPTRPYYEAPYVLAVSDPQYDSLGDISAGEAIGSMLFTPADEQLIAYQNLQAPEERWNRYPLRTGEQGLRFLREGQVEGAIFWAPTIHDLTDGDPRSMGLRLVPLDPVEAPTTPIGMMLREHNAFLRNELDRAIAALIEDGIIAELLAEANLPGSAGGL